MIKLVIRNLLRHRLRTVLTIGSLAVALFLLCFLRSIVTLLDEGIEAAGEDRLVVQSAVSLFVELPQTYQPKIDAVDGVLRTSKWHWFGAYYQDFQNQFAQFGVDSDTIFDVYPEFELVEGSKQAFSANRRGCIIGEGLAARFGWQLGDTVPLIGLIFPHPDGHDVAWEFVVEGIYRVTDPNFDDNAMMFRYEYFDQTMEAAGRPANVGTYVVELEPGADPTQVMARVDGLFENGPQRVQTTSFAEFTAQFVSMFGNIPFFLTSLGGAILIAILLASINTMLMSAREQTRDIGVLKALGFTDGRMFGLLATQSLFLCVLGGALGVAASVALAPGIEQMMAAFWPGYRVTGQTIVLGLGVSVVLGVVAGAFPAYRARRMSCVEAFRAH